MARVLFYLILSSATWAQASVCIKDYKAILRAGPAKTFPVSWTVGKFMPFSVVKREKSWIQVRDFENETHWVYKSLVNEARNCVVVRSTYSYLFSGPGYEYPKSTIEIADKYMPFKQLRRHADWLQVEDVQGNKAWINEKNVWRAPAGKNPS